MVAVMKLCISPAVDILALYLISERRHAIYFAIEYSSHQKYGGRYDYHRASQLHCPTLES
uniref:Uncharacterized protein n=1 Tax=Romanomermis culicivorax TaxID=13658 RepID=A0A915I8A5_ROMCU